MVNFRKGSFSLMVWDGLYSHQKYTFWGFFIKKKEKSKPSSGVKVMQK